MPNPNLIKIKQIDPELVGFIQQTVSGNIATAVATVNNSSYQGPDVVYVSGGDQIIQGNKTFANPITVPYSGGDSQSVNKHFVLDSISSATGTAAANTLSFLYNQGQVFQSGDQTISGNKTFVNPPLITTLATGSGQVATFDQLVNSGISLQNQINSLALISGLNGFAGVTSWNGQSGNILAFGRGNVSIIQRGPITYISGIAPIMSGTGAYLVQGDQGPIGLNINPRGPWGTGKTYSFLDFVSSSGSTFVANSGHLSTVDNQPGTGGSIAKVWNLLASGGAKGAAGPSGGWNFRGTFNSSLGYITNDAVYFNGSSYGYGGRTNSGDLAPTGNSWYIIAKSGNPGPPGAVGNIINSGTITGNFISFSFFQDFFYTGLNLFEAFIPRDFNITGYAIGCVNSGAGPYSLNSGFSGVPIITPLTGSFYQRDSSNVKKYLGGFVLNSGQTYTSSGMNVLVSGNPSRIGLDIFSGLSGLSQITYGLFGL